MKLTRRKFVGGIASGATLVFTGLKDIPAQRVAPRADFSKQKPEVFERLAAEFSRWDQQMLPRIQRS